MTSTQPHPVRSSRRPGRPGHFARLSRAAMALALLGGAAALSGCEEDGKSALCGASAYDATTGMRKNFGTGRVAREVNSFLDTSIALTRAAREIDGELLTTCQAMAADLQIPAAELASPNPMMIPPTRAACDRVATEIRTIIQQNLPAQAALYINYQPPFCEIDLSYTRTCIQTCEDVQVTETEIQCMPGKLVGQCSATCMGQCSGTCGAMCTGQCSGTCTGMCSAMCKGQCSGNCMGKCDGQCSAMDAQGNCMGTCTGTCVGTCDAQCTGTCTGNCNGSCSATCSAACNGSCMGSCRGGCSVAYTAPKCEEIMITRTETRCQQSCETESRAKAECTAPSLTVDFLVSISPAQEAKLRLAVTALRNHYAKILKLGYRTGTVILTSAQSYLRALRGIASGVGEAGAEAVACIGNAVVDVSRAVDVQLSVSVSVSASITASATAQGMASASTM